jgi:hypothetical protein
MMGRNGNIVEWACDLCGDLGTVAETEYTKDILPANWQRIESFVICERCLERVQDIRRACVHAVAVAQRDMHVVFRDRFRDDYGFRRSLMSIVAAMLRVDLTDECLSRARRNVNEENECKDATSSSESETTNDSNGSGVVVMTQQTAKEWAAAARNEGTASGLIFAERLEACLSGSESPTPSDSGSPCTEKPSDTPPYSPST